MPCRSWVKAACAICCCRGQSREGKQGRQGRLASRQSLPGFARHGRLLKCCPLLSTSFASVSSRKVPQHPARHRGVCLAPTTRAGSEAKRSQTDKRLYCNSTSVPQLLLLLYPLLQIPNGMGSGAVAPPTAATHSLPHRQLCIAGCHSITSTDAVPERTMSDDRC